MDKADRQISLHRRIQSVLRRVEDSLLVILVLMIIGMAVTQIVLRNLFDTGIVWGDIMVRILVLWIGMAGAMVASRKGEHISIDILSRYLPHYLRKIISSLVEFATFMVCTAAAFYSVKFVIGEFQYGDMAFAGVPYWLCEAIIPFAFAVIALRYFLLSIHNFTRIEKTVS
jgi:TRAP-type C4-dicarboxylate transport system permease small subunit